MRFRWKTHTEWEPHRSSSRPLSGGGIRLRRRALELRQNAAQRGDQLVAGNVALFELNTELEGIVLRLKLEDEWLRALRPGLLLAALLARFIACQATLQDAMQNLNHLFFG